MPPFRRFSSQPGSFSSQPGSFTPQSGSFTPPLKKIGNYSWKIIEKT